MVLLSPELMEDQREEIIKNLVAIIEREGGVNVIIDVWGNRELAYPVNKQTRGYYYRLEYGAPGNVVSELERNIRITDGIWKFVSVKLNDEYVEGASQAKAEAEPAAAAPEAAPEAASEAAPEAPEGA
jgi:small subunit ribosomal protein S6